MATASVAYLPKVKRMNEMPALLRSFSSFELSSINRKLIKQVKRKKIGQGKIQNGFHRLDRQIQLWKCGIGGH